MQSQALEQCELRSFASAPKTDHRIKTTRPALTPEDNAHAASYLFLDLVLIGNLFSLYDDLGKD